MLVPADGFPVVGLGASAGGLDAFRRLLAVLPAGTGMAFILIQHLDPTHASMMVDLLAGHTPLTVQQATDGMPLEPEHVYLIPPGTYLSIRAGALRLSQPLERHGARLPFDFFLRSLADELGERAICVILSGTGGDGSLGLKAVKAKGGLVIAQEPSEAEYDGMPRSAIMTGAVDLVLQVAEIPQILAKYAGRKGLPPDDHPPDRLAEITDLVHTKTSHDFALYKPGTLSRRIERRMVLAGVEDSGRYLDLLRQNPAELELLAKDLLINVTSFFRDPKAFELLAEEVIPDLVRRNPTDRPLRIWVAGCSTGEETYSLAMLFIEAITAAQRNIKLQVFASDVDEDAVALAREGRYPESIAADVSPPRLARFFTQEEHGHRVGPELRGVVVFTVQDVLADPPFSRLDLISCRNLLIYLRPEAQQKVLLLFHFALSEGGILVLGGSETVGSLDDRFEPISKTQRIYRQIGRSRPGEVTFPIGAGVGARAIWPGATRPAAVRGISARDLTHQALIETYAPASVLVDRKCECLYYSGPTDRYLQVAAGEPSRDLLAMARQGLRTKLRAVVQQASRDHAHATATGAETSYGGSAVAVRIEVHPVQRDGEELLLVSFFEEPAHQPRADRPAEPTDDVSRVAELERELEATRKELESAIHNLEIANEEQKTINQEAMSANEEFQSTNEELMTSREELQSLNEELTALNSQLQETLEHQRGTSNDLQNISGQLWGRDPVPGQRAEHPFLHAGGQVAVQRHRLRHRPATRRSDPLVRRPRSARRCPRGAGEPRAVRPRGRSRRRRLVHPRHLALPHPGQSDRRGGHHVRRHLRDKGGGTPDPGGARLSPTASSPRSASRWSCSTRNCGSSLPVSSFYRDFRPSPEDAVGQTAGISRGRPSGVPSAAAASSIGSRPEAAYHRRL